MTDLNSLMIFAKVVEAKSFSEAARLLKMPASTVSRRVADLEQQLGIRLIERSTRSLRLTDAGSEVLEQAKHSSEISEAVDNTQPLRFLARSTDRRIPGILSGRPCTGVHYRPDCRSNCRRS